jgi:TRAP-type C4-dicarboxylate transport system permease small subunit
MRQVQKFASRLSEYLDWLAGWVLMGSMLLVVCNILLRLFDRPIEGTYEWVGFLTAAAIGLALAYCTVEEGHIAVTFFVDKLAPGCQAAIDFVVKLLSVAFLVLAFWESLLYGASMKASGEVALTTKVPFYPFIYLIALGLLVMALVILSEILKTRRKVVRK